MPCLQCADVCGHGSYCQARVAPPLCRVGFRNANSRLGMHQFQVRIWHAWHHHMALIMLAHVLAGAVRRRFADTLLMMNFNDVVLVTVLARGRPDTDTEDMLAWLLALQRRMQEEKMRSMERKTTHYNANS